MCEPSGVFGRAEDCDGVVGRAERLHAFVGLLTVVETGGHAVDGEVGGGYEGWFCPFAGVDRVVGFDVAVYCERVSAMVDTGIGRKS